MLKKIKNYINKFKYGFISIELVIVGFIIVLGSIGMAVSVRHTNSDIADTTIDRINKDNNDGDISSTVDKGDEGFDNGNKPSGTDITPPVIIGVHDITTDIDVKPDYTSGITARDDIDGQVQVIIDDKNLDYHKIGEYVIYYSAVDKAGNTSTVTATITVKDSDVPVIVGVKPLFAEVGDDIDYIGDVYVKEKNGEKIEVNCDHSSVMETTPGKYVITYWATDSSNNTTTESTYITIQDNTGPIISGTKTINATKGVIPNYLTGITAFDAVDGDVTGKITYNDSNVNINKVGEYAVTYCVTDSSQYNNNDPKGPNKTCVTEKVIVTDNIKPVLIGVKNKTIEFNKNLTSTIINQLLNGVYATDDSDTSEEMEIKVDISNINFEKLGTYIVIYSVTDSSGNSTYANSQITIVDTTGPIFTGDKDLRINLGEEITYGQGVKAIDEFEGEVSFSTNASNVNISKAGTYKFIYNAQDSLGNTSSVEHYITIMDNSAPVLRGVKTEFDVDYGSDYDYLTGITAYDNNDGDLTDKIIVDYSQVENDVLNGKYYVYYSVTDSSGNKTDAKSIVNIKDLSGPVITGIKDYSLTKGDYLPDSSFLNDVKAIDNYDGFVEVTVNTSAINFNSLGTYTIIYTAADSNGNVTTENATVSIKDFTKPNISGVRDLYFEYGSTALTETDLKSGITASDDNDGNITNKIIILGYNNIDFEKLGTYKFTYSVSDMSGNNLSIDSNLIVRDTTPPKIANVKDLIFDLNQDVTKNDIMHTITAFDIYDGDITSKITYTTDLDTSIPNSYNVTYNVTDSNGNESSETANIVIKHKTKPTIIGIINPIEIEGGNVDYDYFDGVTATDAEGNDITSSLEINDNLVDYFKLGTYDAIYTATDNYDNVQSITVKVNIIDTTAPIIYYGEETTIPDVEIGINDKTWIEDYLNELYASDIIDGELDVTIDDTNVDYQTPGTYVVYALSEDNSGNKATKDFNVVIEDINGPVIDIYKESIVMEYSKTNTLKGVSFYKDYVYSAVDDKDGNVLDSLVINESAVDYTTIGDYFVTITVSDSAGNETTDKLYVKIVDTQKPIILNTKNHTVKLSDYLNNQYNLRENVIAQDDYKNTDLTNSVLVTVNNGNPIYGKGIFNILYSVADESGNIATITQTLTITMDNEKPIIVVKENYIKEPFTNKITDKEKYFRDNLVSAYSASGEDITNLVKIDYTKVGNTVGQYVVTYSVTDSGKLTAELNITFEIYNSNPPILLGVKPIIATIDEYNSNSIDFMDGISATDGLSGANITNRVEYTINEGFSIIEAGSYPLVYSVTDTSGNITSLSTTLTITGDSVGPVISLSQKTLIVEYNNQPTNIDEFFKNYVIYVEDEIDGNLFNKLKITSNVDWQTVGLYNVQFSVTNSINQTTVVKMLVKIVDTTPPIFEGIKDIDCTLTNYRNGNYNLLDGVTAKDDYKNTDLTSRIIASLNNNENITTYGKYLINYKVTNNNGNTTEAYANFNIPVDTFSLIFNGNGGTSSLASKPVKFGTEFGELPNASRLGYTFDGWYTSDVDGKKISETDIYSTEGNITVYAHWVANEYIVYFNPDGGSTPINSKVVTFDKKYGDLPTPTKTGYIFEGWYTNLSNGNKVTSDTIYKTAYNSTLYAKYSKDSYTLTVNPNGGTWQGKSEVQTITKEFDDTYFVVAPYKEGHNFVRWNPSSLNWTEFGRGEFNDELFIEGHNSVIGNTSNNEANIELSFKNTPNDSPFNSKMVEISVNGATGYNYGGFSQTKNTYSNGVFTHVFVAKIPLGYQVNAKIGGMGQGGSYEWLSSQNGTGKFETYIYQVKTGQAQYTGDCSPIGTVYIIPTGPSSSAYFKWELAYSNSFEKTSYTVENNSRIYNFNSSTTITAEYEPKTYYIYYNANGGTGAPSSQTKKYGTDLVLSNTKPTKTGYLFEGWATSSTGNVVYNAGSTFKENSGTTLYAVWKKNTFDLTVNPNGGTWQGSSNVQTVTKEYNDNHLVTIPKKTGNIFTGWSISGGNSYTQYGNGLYNDEAFIDGNNSMSIYNNSSNGTVIHNRVSPSSDNPLKNTMIEIRNNGSASPGYGGFYQNTQSTANNVYYHVIVAKIPVGYTINDARNAIGDGGYSTWLTSRAGTGKFETYIYRVNAGSGGSFSTFGHVYISGPSTGFSWYVAYANILNATNSTSDADSMRIYNFLSDSTITANYTPITYTVGYNANGGTGAPSSQTKYNGTNLTLSSIKPTRGSYIFKGWATSSSGGVSYGSGATYSSNSSITLYAVWEPVTYYVYYDTNGGTGAPATTSFGFNTGAKISSTAPYRTGYTFAGWDYSGNHFSQGQAIPSNWGSFTLTAKWNINYYTLTFSDLNPSGSWSTAYGSGRSFSGWGGSRITQQHNSGSYGYLHKWSSYRTYTTSGSGWVSGSTAYVSNGNYTVTGIYDQAAGWNGYWYFSHVYGYTGTSISSALNYHNMGSYANRTSVYNIGINKSRCGGGTYGGTAAQNTCMLNLYKANDLTFLW